MAFKVRDCALITRMVGVDTAMTLRELQERIRACPIESLFHHFCETVIRPTFDDPEYRNDFAVWASRNLRDRVLGERLGILNPYSFEDFEQLRSAVLDILDERLSELPIIPAVSRGDEFRFMQAVTVVFDSGRQLDRPEDFIRELPHMSLSSIYYHFVEARRRTDNHTDDFSAWLADFDSEIEPLLETLRQIDFYFLALPELKRTLIQSTRAIAPEVGVG